MRIPGRQVHQLYRGKAHHHEPFQHHPGRTEYRKDRLPEKLDFTDMERVGHENHGTGVPHRRADGDGLLRRLLLRLRRLRPRAAREPAQDLDSRREAERQMECREPAGTGTKGGQQDTPAGGTAESLESKLAVVQYLL